MWLSSPGMLFFYLTSNQDVQYNHHGSSWNPKQPIYKWMFGETTISYVKIGNHPIETTIYKWLFGVPGLYYLYHVVFDVFIPTASVHSFPWQLFITDFCYRKQNGAKTTKAFDEAVLMALRVTFFIFPSLLHKAFHLFNLLCVTLEIHDFFLRLQLEACCCRCLIKVEVGCKKWLNDVKCTTALCCKGNGDVVFKNQLFGINNRGHYITNPNFMHYYFRKIPQILP